MTATELATRGKRVRKLPWQDAIGLPWLKPPTIVALPHGCILAFDENGKQIEDARK